MSTSPNKCEIIARVRWNRVGRSAWEAALTAAGCLGPGARAAVRRRIAQGVYDCRASEVFLYKSGRAALRDLFGLAFVLMGSFVALFNYAGFRLTQAPFALGSAEVGLLFLVYLGGIFSAGWAGRLTTRLGARRVIRAGIALMLLGILACALPWLVAVLLGMALVTLGFFAAHAVASAQVSARAQGARAQASALYLGAYYLGSSVLGYAAGWVWQLAGWHALLGLLLALCLLALRQTRRL